MQNLKNVQQAAYCVREKRPHATPASIGIVMGTGLGGLAGALEQDFLLPYKEITGFPHSTVESHAGALGHGVIGDTPVWTLQGRFHLYEGYSPAEVCMGVRTLAALGVKTLILTNAAGALNPQFEAGSLMSITDHINFTGQNPLTGANQDSWGPRFPDMSAVYSPRIRAMARQSALELGMPLEHGVYLGLCGPCLETPAETRAFRIMGADAVGMSTVLEAIAARHMGLELLGISCLTNKNLPDCMQETSLEDVISMAGQTCGLLSRLLTRIVMKLGGKSPS